MKKYILHYSSNKPHSVALLTAKELIADMRSSGFFGENDPVAIFLKTEGDSRIESFDMGFFESLRVIINQKYGKLVKNP